MDDNPARLIVTLRVPEGADRDEVRRAVEELTAALDAYHRALGGSGLVIESWTVTTDDDPEPGTPR
jgi:hypothetical protein